MPHDFLPAREGELDGWLLNFKTLIAADPAKYNLSAGDSAAINTAYANWHTAFLAAVEPTTRTVATVRTKNEQKSSVAGVVRRYATLIRGNTAISDALKIGLGLRVRAAIASPVPVPSTHPQVNLIQMSTARQLLRITDGAVTGTRARPANTTGALLFRIIGTEAVHRPDGAEFVAMVTKGTYVSEFVHADHGKVATYFARWANAKGEVGPWSSGLSVGIAA